jgi:hypothetical protein
MIVGNCKAVISWNEAWTGMDQVRFYKLSGNNLTITSAPNQRDGVSPVWGHGCRAEHFADATGSPQ